LQALPLDMQFLYLISTCCWRGFHSDQIRGLGSADTLPTQ
jgi:hypothetical protein